MRKYSVLIWISLISLAVGTIFFYITGRIEILAAIIATGISLSIGIQQSKNQNDIIFKELFIAFNKKYDNKFNEALEEIIKQYEKDKTRMLSSEENKLIIDYLNLCAEEYLWKTLHRIPDNVWCAWEIGIVYYLNQPLINQVVVKEKKQRGSYYGLFDKLKNKVENI